MPHIHVLLAATGTSVVWAVRKRSNRPGATPSDRHQVGTPDQDHVQRIAERETIAVRMRSGPGPLMQGAALTTGMRRCFAWQADCGVQKLRLTVPWAQVSVMTQQTAAVIEKPVGHMTKILIVDDDTTIRDMLDTVLSEEGYATYQAGNGRDGVELAEQVNPELILMDIMMPVVDGATAIGQLRDNPRTRAIRVIAMSAGSTLLQRIDQLQADGVLAKPFDLDELLANIEFQLRDAVHA